MNQRRRFFDKDADLSDLQGRRIAILGYGNQGRAQALNLRDSGVDVCVGQRKGSVSRDKAVADGFQVFDLGEAVARSAIHHVLLPDEIQGRVYQESIEPALHAGDTLVFATGYSIHFQHILPRADVDVVLVAPKGPGLLLRSAFETGGGIFGLVGAHQDVSGIAMRTALALSKGLGCTRVAAIESSFRDEAETDLFGEQVVLCGGVSALVKGAVETLLEAGYPPELAYIECFHELKQCVDLMWKMGLPGMWKAISDTAEYGAMTRGPRIVTGETRAEMRRILSEIQSGAFAKQWDAECAGGKPTLRQGEAEDAGSALERTGAELRKLLFGEG